jgi:hypothetical protein
MTSVPLKTLVSVFLEHSQLLEGFTLDDVARFVDLACLLKPTLDLPHLWSVHNNTALDQLLSYINNFLKVCLNLNDTEAIGVLWEAFRETV